MGTVSISIRNSEIRDFVLTVSVPYGDRVYLNHCQVIKHQSLGGVSVPYGDRVYLN